MVNAGATATTTWAYMAELQRGYTGPDHESAEITIQHGGAAGIALQRQPHDEPGRPVRQHRAKQHMQPVQPEPDPVIALVRHRQPPHWACAHVHAGHAHIGHVPVVAVAHVAVGAIHVHRAHVPVVPVLISPW